MAKVASRSTHSIVTYAFSLVFWMESFIFLYLRCHIMSNYKTQ